MWCVIPMFNQLVVDVGSVSAVGDHHDLTRRGALHILENLSWLLSASSSRARRCPSIMGKPSCPVLRGGDGGPVTSLLDAMRPAVLPQTAKRLSETTSGELWLESDLGKGTTIYFTLPEA